MVKDAKSHERKGSSAPDSEGQDETPGGPADLVGRVSDMIGREARRRLEQSPARRLLDRRRLNAETKLIAESGLFDEAFYRERNPDVVAAGLEPIQHFVSIGWQEGRNPSANFDVRFYLRKNRDVARLKVNPLVHYLEHGRQEGRPTRAPESEEGGAQTPAGRTAKPPAGRGAATPASPSAKDLELLERVYRYKEYKARRGRGSVVVYTVITGGYDTLKQPEVFCDDWDYVCITDRPIPGTYVWDFRYIDYFNADTTRTARYYKTHPHHLFPEYEESIWIDANLVVAGPHLDRAIGRLRNQKATLGVLPHPHWDCVYVEAEKCVAFNKEDPDILAEQVAFLRERNYREHCGLIETAILYRRHHEPNMRAADEEWWQLICRFSKRDQMSFNYVIDKHAVSRQPIFEHPGESTRQHSDYRYFLHRGEANDRHPAYVPPSFNRNLPAISKDIYALLQGGREDSTYAAEKQRTCDIIVPVFNALPYVKKCMEALLPRLGPNHRVILVDDASDEPTAAYLRELATQNPAVQLLTNDHNLGYTRNVNRGLSVSTAEFVVILNSDTEVTDDWLYKMLRCAYSAPEIGLVGPLSNAASWQSVPEIEDTFGGMAVNDLPAGMTLRDVATVLARRSSHPLYPRVHLLNGFCLGIKRQVLDQVGQFDDAAFPRGYGEEDDFCLRAGEAGFALAVATQAYVFHAKSKSFGKQTREAIVAQSFETLRAKYGGRRLSNCINSTKLHPGLRAVRAALDSQALEQPPRPDAGIRFTTVELPEHRSAYAAPQTSRDYETERPIESPAADIDLIAFYLPQFYPFELNDKTWGKGFTEWTNVTRAVPLFRGHYQPKLPDALGFYDTRLKDTLVQQASLAKRHGIRAFCFHHYFFGQEPVMRVPLEMLLDNPDIDIQFCLHWANEPWTTTWTYTFMDSARHRLIIDQAHTPENDLAFIRDAERALRDPRYFKVGGKPLLMVYRPGLFPDVRETLERWRDYCRRVGIGELHLAMVQTNAEGEVDPRQLGFDAAVEFPPHLVSVKGAHHDLKFFVPDFKGAVIDYREVARKSLDKPTPPYTKYRGIMARWDNTARKIEGPAIYIRDTPQAYGAWLERLIADSRRNLPEGQRLIFVNAWNEWAEGAYLEPDRKFGYAYLNATSRAVATSASAAQVTGPEAHERVAFQIHAFHPDVFATIFARVKQVPFRVDLLISTDTEDKRRELEALTGAYDNGEVVIRVVPNRGRDIGPFVVGFGDLLPAYDYALHLHTKKSVYDATLAGWLDYLVERLIGGPDVLARVFEHLSRPEVGLVFPEPYYAVRDRLKMGANAPGLNRLFEGTGRQFTSADTPVFPSGSMFFFKPRALAGLFDRKLSLEDFEEEAGQIDGTLAHAIERSFVYFAENAGFSYAVV